MNQNMEILAPVGNREMLLQAISHGADAVYLGLENFNARAKADNFDSKTIREDIKLCHLFGVRVYITLNTLVSNNEFDKVMEIACQAYKAKADAFIVQDIGLICELKKQFPDIEIHASTQCGVCNAYGAEVFKRLGVSRVVVARETTLEDIRRIVNLGLEVEVFVQGALCVCYSGSCYLSSIHKHRSGNRGECLQLCRLPFKLVEGGAIKKQGYLLSTRDLSLLSRLEELRQAGVTSLKIEGRLRRPAYLAQAIDSVKKALSGNVSYEKEDYNLRKVFSRGEYNKGIYLDSKTNGGIINSAIGSHGGVEIGEVKHVKPFKDIFEIVIESSHCLKKNDGIKCVKDDSEVSLGVGSVEIIGKNQYKIYTKSKPQKGAKVFLTVDSVSEEKLVSGNKKLQIDVKVDAVSGKPLQMILSHNDISVKVTGDIVQEALKSALTKEQIEESVKKTGNIEFDVVNIAVATKNAFIAKSELNKLRRDGMLCLREAIINDFELKNRKHQEKCSLKSIKNDNIGFDSNLYIIDDANKLKHIKNANSHIVIAPNIYNYEYIKCIKDAINNKFSTKPYLYLPVIANYKDLKILDEILFKFGKNSIGVVAGSIYGVKYAFDGFDVITGYNNNVANNKSVEAFHNLGVKGVTKSIEENLFEDTHRSLTYVGNPALMTIAMCPYIEHMGSSCNKCMYRKNMQFVMHDGLRLDIRRQKIHDCYFELIAKKQIPHVKNAGFMIDLRD